MSKWFSNNWLKLVAIAFVAGALFDFPYVYFQLMTWIVAGAAVMTALQARERGQSFLMWLFVLVAVVFNPVAPLYIRQDIWRLIDLAAAALFIISLFLIHTHSSKKV